MISNWHVWAWSIILGPIVWIVIIGTLLFLRFELKAIRKWYFGLPIYQYPAMLLVILGIRHIKQPYGEFKQLDGRWYFTINTTGFIVEKNNK